MSQRCLRDGLCTLGNSKFMPKERSKSYCVCFFLNNLIKPLKATNHRLIKEPYTQYILLTGMLYGMCHMVASEINSQKKIYMRLRFF